MDAAERQDDIMEAKSPWNQDLVGKRTPGGSQRRAREEVQRQGGRQDSQRAYWKFSFDSSFFLS